MVGLEEHFAPGVHLATWDLGDWPDLVEIVDYYVEHPDTMGSKARARIAADGVWRAACDYVAGMTDRYALEEIAKFGLNK